MASSTKKGRHGGDRGNPALKLVEGEIIPPKVLDGQVYRQSVAKLVGVGGRPSRYQNKKELIADVAAYLDSLQKSDGTYLAAPSMSGLGVWLGYASTSWHRDAPCQDMIQHIKFFIKAWRENKIVLPHGGVNPAALMFLINRDDRIAAEQKQNEERPLALGDTRPDDVAAVIDDVWSTTKGDGE